MEHLISIVLPVYNQADHIRDVMQNYEEAFTRVHNPHEFILVTNNCTDNSVQVCQQLAVEYESIHTINSDKKGWGWAVRLGLAEARGDVLCYTNMARTSAQDLILLVLYAVANPNTVIKASRKIRDNWQRRIGSLLYNLECRAFFDLNYWDVNGTPKVFPRTFDKLLVLRRDDDLVDLEFIVTCRRENYPLLEVPIFSTRRHGGKSTTNYRTALRLFWGAYQFWQSRHKE